MPPPPPSSRAQPRPSTLVLIPACNEAARIGSVVEGARTATDHADVLVIDDGSQDGTAEVARRHGADTIEHSFNLGYGAALQTGYRYALARGFDRVVQMDADGQHEPRSIRALLAGLDDGADLVLGSRYREDGTAPKTSLLRRMGSRLFAWIVTKWTGVRVTDPTSGFQAMSRTAIREVARDSFPEDYPDADVLIALHRAGVRLTERPVVMHERSGGVSMHRGSRAAYYGYKMFLSLLLLPIRRASPFREGRRPTTAPTTI